MYRLLHLTSDIFRKFAAGHAFLYKDVIELYLGDFRMHKCFAGAPNLALSIGLILACARDLHAASTILAATPLGPVKSTDGGVTWSVIPVNVNRGPLSQQPGMSGLAVDPKTPSIWYFVGYSPSGVPGLYKSLDSGETWTGIPFGDWPIQANIGSVQSPAGTVLTVHH